MNKTLFDRTGKAVAYIAPDHRETIYLWEGRPVAYLFEEMHIYGINGRHLAWFINGIVYNTYGERVGFTFETCPVPPGDESAKGKKIPIAEIRPRWRTPPSPALTFNIGLEDLFQILERGEVPFFETAHPDQPILES